MAEKITGVISTQVKNIDSPEWEIFAVHIEPGKTSTKVYVDVKYSWPQGKLTDSIVTRYDITYLLPAAEMTKITDAIKAIHATKMVP